MTYLNIFARFTAQVPFMTKGQGEKGSWLWIPKGSTIQVTGGKGENSAKPASQSASSKKLHWWSAEKRNRSKRARAKRSAQRMTSSSSISVNHDKGKGQAESESEEFEFIQVEEEEDQHWGSWPGGQKDQDWHWQSWKVVNEDEHWQPESWRGGQKDQDWHWQSWKVVNEDEHWQSESWPGEKDQDWQSWKVVQEDEHWQSWPGPRPVGEEDQHSQDHRQEVQACLHARQCPRIVPPRWEHPVGEVAVDVRGAFGVAVELSAALRVAKPKSKSQPLAQTQSKAKCQPPRKPKVILPFFKPMLRKQVKVQAQGRPSVSSKLNQKKRSAAKPSARVKPEEEQKELQESSTEPKPSSSSSLGMMVKQEVEADDNKDMIACVEVSWTDEPEPDSDSNGMIHLEEMKPELEAMLGDVFDS